MSYLELLRLAAPEAILVVTTLVVLTIGLVTGRRKVGATVSVAGEAGARSAAKAFAGDTPAATASLALCSLVAALGLAITAAVIVRLPEQAMLFHGMLVVSPLNSLFKIICLVLAFFTVLLVRGERSLPNHGEYLALILLATVGLLLLVGSEELLMIFIGLELTGLSLYVLAAFDKAEQRSAEAGLKYFLFGSMASAVTLFGLSFVYGLTGTTSLAALGERLTTLPVEPLLAAGIVMTLIGFAFKIAAAPFHLWAPDAYQGAPVSTAAFIASGSKVASFVVLGKVVLIGFGPAHGSADWQAMVAGWTPLLAVLAALSILLGNFVALVQKNVRRLLAYSAVAHAGYTLLGLVAAGRDGFAATLFYTTIYGLTLIGAFGVVGFVRRETGGDDLRDFAGLRDALAAPGRVHGGFYAFARRAAAARGIFRQILSLQCRASGRSKPRAALARRARSLRQPRLALLLSDCAEGDLSRRSRAGPAGRPALRLRETRGFGPENGGAPARRQRPAAWDPARGAGRTHSRFPAVSSPAPGCS